MAVVAQETRIVVVLLDVVRNDVVVPVRISVGHQPLREVREGDIRVAAHATVGDRPVVPVIPALDAIVDERIGGGDPEDIADPRIIIHVERVAIGSTLDFVVATAAREVVLPRLPREQHPHAPIGVNAEDGDVGVTVGPEMNPGALTPGVGTIAPIGPDFDARAIIDAHRRHRGRAGRRRDKAEQRKRGQHTCLRAEAFSRPCAKGGTRAPSGCTN